MQKVGRDVEYPVEDVPDDLGTGYKEVRSSTGAVTIYINPAAILPHIKIGKWPFTRSDGKEYFVSIWTTNALVHSDQIDWFDHLITAMAHVHTTIAKYEAGEDIVTKPPVTTKGNDQ